jgi:hypothetical protein
MKVIWEPTDIRAGRRYGKLNVTERWMIGYKVSTPSFMHLWYSVSLTDGMVTSGISDVELAASLTEDGYLPEELLIAWSSK